MRRLGCARTGLGSGPYEFGGSMAGDLPEYYFRVRENGAFVFRVDTENRQRRIDMDQIAVVNIRKGEIKAHGERELSARDMEVIEEWMAERLELIEYRDIDGHPPRCRLPQHNGPLGAGQSHRCAA